MPQTQTCELAGTHLHDAANTCELLLTGVSAECFHSRQDHSILSSSALNPWTKAGPRQFRQTTCTILAILNECRRGTAVVTHPPGTTKEHGDTITIYVIYIYIYICIYIYMHIYIYIYCSIKNRDPKRRSIEPFPGPQLNKTTCSDSA